MRLYRKLEEDEREILSVVGLGFINKWLRIKAHTTMMTALVERWDNRMCTFHLPRREASITLLDVWRILKIPIHGVIPEYRLDEAEYYLHQVCKYDRLPMDETQMHHGQVIHIKHILCLVLFICGLISGRVLPNLGGHGFPIGWSRCVYYMVHDCMDYAWGAAMLGQLYHDMHLVLYREYQSLSLRVTLLHIWAWEHIAITRLVGVHDR